MTNGFDDLQKIGKENFDVALKSVGVLTKGFQALAAEAADYSRQSFEDGAAAAEKLFSAPSLDKAVEAQADFLRATYEGYVGRATRIGEIVAGIARETYAPYENLFGRRAG